MLVPTAVFQLERQLLAGGDMHRTGFWITSGLLLALFGCKSQKRVHPLAPSAQAGAKGEPVTLRYRLVPGQCWLYDVKAHSTVATTSGAFFAVVMTYALELKVQ